MSLVNLIGMKAGCSHRGKQVDVDIDDDSKRTISEQMPAIATPFSLQKSSMSKKMFLSDTYILP